MRPKDGVIGRFLAWLGSQFTCHGERMGYRLISERGKPMPIPTQNDVIQVDVRIDYNALREMVRAEVVTALRRLAETPIAELAKGEIAPPPAPRPPYPSRSVQKRLAVQQSARAAAPKPKPAKKKAATKAAAPKDESAADQARAKLVSILQAHPQGIRASLLRAQLGWDTHFYQYHMKRAKDAKIFKIEGEKGGATYFPNPKGIEKANGVAEAAAAPN